MKYKFTKDYIEKRRKSMIYTSIIFAFFAVVLCLIGISVEAYGMFVGLIFLFIAWPAYKNSKSWIIHASKVYLSISDQDIIVGGDGFEDKRSIDSIKQMTIQKRKKNIVSIILIYESSSQEKLEGFESLQEISNKIEDVIGENKVKKVSWFHR
jgi:hypothetical protein